MIADGYRSDDLLCNLGLILCGRQEFSEACSVLSEALKINSQNSAVLNNYARALIARKQFQQAKELLLKAVEIDSAYAAPRVNLAMIHIDLGEYREAEAVLKAALEIDQSNKAARANLMIVYQKTGRTDEVSSLFSVRDAISAVDDVPFTAGDVFHAKCNVLDWADYESDRQLLKKATLQGLPVQTPFVALSVHDDPQLQQKASEVFVASKFPMREPLVDKGSHYGNPRIKVAYLSSDFHDHATMYLMLRLLRGHDPKTFETFALSSKDVPSAKLRQRIVASVDHFIDISQEDDESVARWIAGQKIDILVDLKGVTENSRLGVLSYRPAPHQLHYLGFPATTGASYVDAFVGDAYTNPPDHDGFFTERVMRLSACYQPNDDAHLRIVPRDVTRESQGLRDDAFVYASFNANYKITPTLMDHWVNILNAVANAQFWVYAKSAEAQTNFLREWSNRGGNVEQIVFASHVDFWTNLARQPLADLFLDTYPCNAHTTASDALLMGLPVLTVSGQCFASRVAGSLLHERGMDDLVVNSLEKYEEKAISYGLMQTQVPSVQPRNAKLTDSSWYSLLVDLVG